jgi:hypothetical protein
MHHDRFDAFTRRAAMRGLAAALLGGVVAGSPVARRTTSVLAGESPCQPVGEMCNPGDPCPCCNASGDCDPSIICASPDGGGSEVCIAPPPPPDNNNNDKKKHDGNDKNDDNDHDGNNGDGIFWPCTIPWFANNPACNGTLGGLQGR